MKRAPAKRTTPKDPLSPVSHARRCVLDSLDESTPLKATLDGLVPLVGATSAVALLYQAGEQAFRVVEQSKVGAKQRRGLDAFLPSLPELAQGKKVNGGALRSHGTVLVFSDAESKSRGCRSVLAYYVVRSGKLLGALLFCQLRADFDKLALKTLDSIAGPLSLIVQNRLFNEDALLAGGLVNQDGLTGLYNHRYFQETLSNELLKSQRFGHSVALLLIDVDHFKKVNDTYGHPQGDAVLRAIAEILRTTIRAYDVAARYGGEEFAVVLPHSDQGQALQVAERVRTAVASYAFSLKGSKKQLELTVSVGVAVCPANAKTKAELIDRADQALYLSKSEGRNKVCLSLASSSEPIRVGFCPATLKSAYYRDVLSGMEDVIREIKQIELCVQAPKQESQYEVLPKLFRKFTAERLDAVAICTQSPTAVQDLEILHKANIPVFFFNVPKPISDRKIRSYVGYDQGDAGATVGQYLGRVLRGKGKVAVLEGLTEPTSRMRVSGFKKALKVFPEIEIVAVESAEWAASRAKKVTSGLLRQHEDLDAIFAVNDAMALGAVEAVKAKGLLGRIFVIGLDGTRDALSSIREGQLTATLDTGPREMGRILLRSIVRGLIREEKVERRISSPIGIVTVENVEHAI